MKSHAVYGMMLFPMTLSDCLPGFQGHGTFREVTIGC